MFAWWERVGENFADLDDMEPDDWEDVDFEGEVEHVDSVVAEEGGLDEVAALANDSEFPPSGDLQGLHDMLERIIRDVQQLQEGSD